LSATVSVKYPVIPPDAAAEQLEGAVMEMRPGGAEDCGVA
jgi:hypothetical protein